MQVPRILRHFQLKILTLQFRFLMAKDLMSKDGVTIHLMSKDGWVPPHLVPQDEMPPIFGHKVCCHNILCCRVKIFSWKCLKILGTFINL